MADNSYGIGDVLVVLAQAQIHPDLDTWTDERIAYMMESVNRFGERQAQAVEAAQSAASGGSGTAPLSGSVSRRAGAKPGVRDYTAAMMGYKRPTG